MFSPVVHLFFFHLLQIPFISNNHLKIKSLLSTQNQIKKLQMPLTIFGHPFTDSECDWTRDAVSYNSNIVHEMGESEWGKAGGHVWN